MKKKDIEESRHDSVIAEFQYRNFASILAAFAACLIVLAVI